jgi:hypothetical protein
MSQVDLVSAPSIADIRKELSSGINKKAKSSQHQSDVIAWIVLGLEIEEEQ